MDCCGHGHCHGHALTDAGYSAIFGGVGGGPVGVTVGEGHRDRDVVRERDVLRDRDGCRDDDRGSGGVEGSDLSRATRLAIRLETSFGFGSLGLGCLADDLDNRDLPLFDRLRAAVEAIIDRRSPRTSYLLTPKQEISGLISCDSSFRSAINWLSANTSLEVRKGGISASA